MRSYPEPSPIFIPCGAALLLHANYSKWLGLFDVWAQQFWTQAFIGSLALAAFIYEIRRYVWERRERYIKRENESGDIYRIISKKRGGLIDYWDAVKSNPMLAIILIITNWPGLF